MPLNAKDEAFSGGFHGFNNAVISPRRGNEARRKPIDSLMMKAVDFELQPSNKGSQAAAHFDAYCMRARGARLTVCVVTMRRGANFAGDVLNQRAAKRDIEDLMAAANAEHRHVIINCPTGNSQFEGVARVVDVLSCGVRFAAIVNWVNITASRQKHAVETVINCVQRLHIQAAGHVNGQTTCLGNRKSVCGISAVVR